MIFHFFKDLQLLKRKVFYPSQILKSRQPHNLVRIYNSPSFAHLGLLLYQLIKLVFLVTYQIISLKLFIYNSSFIINMYYLINYKNILIF